MSSHSNKPIAVVKVGGDMLLEPIDRANLATNVKNLIEAGWHCVILHGGGPQVNKLQAIHGLIPNKVAGRRITSTEDLMVVKQALCGEVNVDLVSSLIACGVPAFGCHGASGQLISAVKRPPRIMPTEGDQSIDFGEVGDVVTINTHILKTLFNADQVPVIASLGVGQDGRVFNINADTTVAHIARALRAQLLILSTNVGGIFYNINDISSRIQTLTQSHSRKLIQQGVITDGMIPKVEEAFALLTQGVGSVVICNARSSNQFVEVATNSESSGTRLVTEQET